MNYEIARHFGYVFFESAEELIVHAKWPVRYEKSQRSSLPSRSLSLALAGKSMPARSGVADLRLAHLWSTERAEDVPARTNTGIDASMLEQPSNRLSMGFRSIRGDDPIVPVETEPLQIFDHSVHVGRIGSLVVDVVEAQHHASILAARAPPGQKQAEGVAEVEQARRARRQPAHHWSGAPSVWLDMLLVFDHLARVWSRGCPLPRISDRLGSPSAANRSPPPSLSHVPKKSKAKNPKFTAKTADRHVLYQKSVQAPDYEVKLLSRMYKKAYEKKALSMREDFCGTAILCSAWVASHKERTATGVDLCADTLAWGKEHNIDTLAAGSERVTLLREDVRVKRPGKFDIINALNFSYWVFKTRDDMREYFESVRAGLEDEGLFLCDAYGGWESQEPMMEPRKVVGGFTYVWDQHSFDPITHDVTNHIHFEFKDGSKMKKAFTYEWRYWTLPELTELLKEAGFSQVHVYWDQAADDEEENYRRTTHAENQPGWLAYLVALK